MSPLPAIRLFTYKQTDDNGFAPNPFHGACTLATCKWQIRKSKHFEDWIAGFTSRRLNGDAVGDERLVYLMQVAEKLPFEVYHTDPRFAAKIPVQGSKHFIDTVGDNVYGAGDSRVPNSWHTTAEQIADDIRGCFVLIGTTFAYFGSEPLDIPDELRPEIPVGVAGHGVRTADSARAQAFVDYVLAQGTGIHARPTSWRTGDTNWQRRRSCG